MSSGILAWLRTWRKKPVRIPVGEQRGFLLQQEVQIIRFYIHKQ